MAERKTTPRRKDAPTNNETRKFDAMFESTIARLQIAPVDQPDSGDAPETPGALPVKPPRPETVSRLVNFIKKI